MENLREFWYLWLIFIILIIITAIVIKKTSSAVRKKYGKLNQQDKTITRYKYLVDNYSELSEDKIKTAPVLELSQGIAATVQRRLEKSDDFNGEFKKVPDWQKEIYAFDVLTEYTTDGKKLSDFFRQNGEPLFSLTFSFFEKINGREILGIMKKMYPMLDENNESVSVDTSLIEELDKKFTQTFNADTVDGAVKEFVLKNYNNNQ